MRLIMKRIIVIDEITNLKRQTGVPISIREKLAAKLESTSQLLHLFRIKSDIMQLVKTINLMNLLILISLYQMLLAKDIDTINFIKHFIENENKPTQLVFNVCWRKEIQIALVNELSKISVHCSTSMKSFKFLDHHTVFLIDLDCRVSKNILLSSTNLLRSPYRWLAITNSLNSSVLRDSPILSDSDFVLAEKTIDGYKMTEVYKVSPTNPMLRTLRGYYNGTLIDIRPHRALFRRRKDVMGQPITMVNVIQDSNTTRYHLPRENRLEPQYDSIAKISWSQVRIAFEMLNATPRYIYAYRWGYKRNGSWDGMINDLRTGAGDVGSNCLVMANRLEAVVYTDVLVPFRVRFIFRQPPLSYVSNIFSLPFSTNVWLAVIAVTALSTFTLFLASQHEVKFGKSPTLLNGTVGDALLLTMSAVSQQGCIMEPRKTSGRILVWILFTALMALYAAYSANIVVLLRAPSNSINSLSQLASSKLAIAAHDVDYNHIILKIFKDPVRLKILKRVEPAKGKNQFYHMNEGVEMIRQGLFAFHSIVDPVYRRIEQTFREIEKCDLMEVDYMNDFPPFTPVRKDSPYLELLRVVFKQIRESGIHPAIYKRLQVPKPKCMDKGTSFSSVGLLDLRPVIFLEVFGIALSVIILFVEIIIFRLNYRWKGKCCPTK